MRTWRASNRLSSRRGRPMRSARGRQAGQDPHRQRAQKTVAQPDGCPFGSFSAESYDATNIKWSTSSYPTVTVADSSSDPYYDLGETTGPNGGPAWAVTSVTEGEAFVTGNYDSFFDDDGTFDDTVTFSVDGTAEIVDGKVVITINDGYGY